MGWWTKHESWGSLNRLLQWNGIDFEFTRSGVTILAGRFACPSISRVGSRDVGRAEGSE